MKTKHVPERTCAACGAKKPQSELLRLASHQGAAPVLDANGKAPGRGAYLCISLTCIETALKRKSLERSLKVKQPPEAGLKEELRRAVQARLETVQTASTKGGL